MNNGNTNNNARSRLPFVIFICMLCIMAVLAIYLSATADLEEDIENISGDAIADLAFYADNDSGGYAGIPDTMNLYQYGSEGRIYLDIPESLPGNAALCFRAMHMYFDARIGDNIIYSPEYADNNLYTDSMGVDWALISLSNNHAGERLIITYRLAYDKPNAGFDRAMIASPDKYILSVIGGKLAPIFTCVVYIAIGIVLIILGLSVLRFMRRDFTIFWLGALALSVAAYCLLETQALQIFVSNARLIHLLIMFALLCIPIPAAAYIDSLLDIRPRKLVPAFSLLVLIAFLVTTILNALKIRDYHESLPFIQAFTVLAILFMAAGIVAYIIRQVKAAKRINFYIATMITGVLAIMITGLIDMLRYWTGRSPDPAANVRYGFLIFLLSFAAASSERIVSAFQAGSRAKLIAKLAYEDGLTGLKNRTSYQEACDDIEKNGLTAGIVMMDLNNLKYVNDNFGHDDGDDMLNAAADLLRSVFRILPDAECYRIGGDEFVAIIRNGEAERLCDAAVDSLRDAYGIFNSNPGRKFDLIIAAGYAVYDPRGRDGISRDLKSVMEEADDLMYIDKKNLKAKGAARL